MLLAHVKSGRRDQLDLMLKPCTNYFKRSLAYCGTVLWNSLSLDICQSPCLDEFKSKLKNYHFDGYFMRIFTKRKQEIIIDSQGMILGIQDIDLTEMKTHN